MPANTSANPLLPIHTSTHIHTHSPLSGPPRTIPTHLALLKPTIPPTYPPTHPLTTHFCPSTPDLLHPSFSFLTHPQVAFLEAERTQSRAQLEDMERELQRRESVVAMLMEKVDGQPPTPLSPPPPVPFLTHPLSVSQCTNS